MWKRHQPPQPATLSGLSVYSIKDNGKKDTPSEDANANNKPAIELLASLGENLLRWDAVWVKLRHVFDLGNLVSINVILQPELDKKCDAKTDKSGNHRPRKSLDGPVTHKRCADR